ARRCQRAVAVDDAEGVESRLQRLDPGEQDLGGLDRRQRLFAIQISQRFGRGKSDLGLARHVSSAVKLPRLSGNRDAAATANADERDQSETRKCKGCGSVAMPITGQAFAVRGSGSPSHSLLSRRMRRNWPATVRR